MLLGASGASFAGVICEVPEVGGVPVGQTVVTGVDVDVDFPPGSTGVDVSIDTVTLTPCLPAAGTLTTNDEDIDTGDGSVLTTRLEASGLVSGATLVSSGNVFGLRATFGNAFDTSTRLTVNGDARVTDDLFVSDNAAISGGLSVTEDINVNSNANVGGNLAVSGNAGAQNLSVTNAINSESVTTTTVNATDVNASSVQATTIVSAPVGQFDNLNAGSINTESITSRTGNFNTVNASVGNFDTFNSQVGNIDVVNAISVSTGSLQADTISAGAISAGSVSASSVNAGVVTAGAVNAGRVTAGTVTTSGVIRAGGGFDATGNKIRNVADGMAPSDAVNLKQLTVVQDQVTLLNEQLTDTAQAAYEGIAGATALASIPAPTPGKNSALGLGLGNFRGTNAVAMGGSFLIPNTPFQVKVGASLTGDHKTLGAGIGWSF